jgi:hypothetical protein
MSGPAGCDGIISGGSRRLPRHNDALEHHGERLTPIGRCVGSPFEHRVNLDPDGLPFGTLASQIELGQHAFEPVDQFRMACVRKLG